MVSGLQRRFGECYENDLDWTLLPGKLREVSICMLIAWAEPRYKIGFLRTSQRFLLAESGTGAVSLFYLSLDREREKV